MQTGSLKVLNVMLRDDVILDSPQLLILIFCSPPGDRGWITLDGISHFLPSLGGTESGTQWTVSLT